MNNWDIYKINYIEDNKRVLSKNLIEHEISVQYKTTPPFGDDIYAVFLKNKLFPFWIYGRNVMLLNNGIMIAESVSYHTWDPITTVVIDLKKEKYSYLNDWYTDINIQDNIIIFSNRYQKNKTFHIENLNHLIWEKL